MVKSLRKYSGKTSTKQKTPEKLTDKEFEFKQYVDQHREEMKQASKAVDKKLKLNRPKKAKNYKYGGAHRGRRGVAVNYLNFDSFLTN